MEKTTDVHLTLPADLLVRFDQAARERGVRRVSLFREVVEEYLGSVEAQRTADAMQTYVEALAPASGDFVHETDSHTVQRLLRETEW